MPQSTAPDAKEDSEGSALEAKYLAHDHPPDSKLP